MSRFPLVLALCAAPVLLDGCVAGSTPPTATATPEMSEVLAERVAMHARERSAISLQEARDVPSLVEAAYAIKNVQGLPASIIAVSQVTPPQASGAAGPLSATLYRPELAKDTPVIIYFPGGTWATRRDASSDETARQLASRTGWVVVVPKPRLAPEAKFPAIHDDALALYQWARAEMRGWGGDPTRVILAGEGPGANLALSTALTARDRRLPMPDALLLVTPWAGTATSSASMGQYGRFQPLTRATISWSQRIYAPNDRANPRIDLADRSDLAGLPPTTIVLAEMDPLRSEGETLAERMRAAGNRVDVRSYRGVTHEFFGLGGYVPRAAEAEADVTWALKARFDAPPPRIPISRSRARR